MTRTLVIDELFFFCLLPGIQQPNGIVVITGPTGFGKTTTLYGVINHIRRPGINISTVE